VEQTISGESELTPRTLNGHAMSVWQCLVPLVLLTAIYTAGRAILALYGLVPSKSAEFICSFEFRIILVGWVFFDRQASEFSAPFEFDAFMFFAWIFVLPYYLLRTRGRRGLLLLAGIYGLAAIPYLAAPIAAAMLKK
jgi:hypothetical protein